MLFLVLSLLATPAILLFFSADGLKLTLKDVEGLATTTVANLGFDQTFSAQAQDGEDLTAICEHGVMGAVKAWYGSQIGSINCPLQRQIDNAGECPGNTVRDIDGNYVCPEGQYCHLGREPTLNGYCCANSEDDPDLELEEALTIVS